MGKILPSLQVFLQNNLKWTENNAVLLALFGLCLVLCFCLFLVILQKYLKSPPGEQAVVFRQQLYIFQETCSFEL